MTISAKKSERSKGTAKIATVTCRLEYASEAEFIERHAQNLSRTGIFIGGKRPRGVGEIVRFELALSDGAPLLTGEGEVMWTRKASPSGAPPGMGVRYTELDASGEALIQKVMAYKAANGDKFDKPSRYSMMPTPNDAQDDGDGHREAKAASKGKQKKMKKLDMNEIDAMLDEIATSEVSTKQRARFRRRDLPKLEPRPAAIREAVPSKMAAADTTPSNPSMPVPHPSASATAEPPPVVPEEAPGVIFDEDEFDADEYTDDSHASVAPPPLQPEETAEEDTDDSGETGSERISQEEIASIAAEEELGDDAEMEAELLEPDEDSGTVPPKEAMDLSEDDLAGVLEDVYSSGEEDSAEDVIQDEELDALLSALEETEGEEEIEEVEEIDDLDVLEIKEED